MKSVFCLALLACSTMAFADVTADQIWADQLCGGMASYKENSVKFEECSKNALQKAQWNRMWAEQRCGGNAAYQKDMTKFNICVNEEIMNVQK